MSSRQFGDLAAAAIRDDCRANPTSATFRGEHSFDDLLEDPSPAAGAERRRALIRLLADLAALDGSGLEIADQVDRDILETAARTQLLALERLDEASWNPMLHNPGQALYALLSRDFAPLEQRLASLMGRVRGIPDYLAAARDRLDVLSPVHVETAIEQLDGLTGLLRQQIPAAAAGWSQAAGLLAACERAGAAVGEHQQWLRDRKGGAEHPARLGADLFAAKLELTLASVWEPKALLEQAYRDLERVEAELAEAVGGSGPHARASRDAIAAEFARLSEDAPTSDTILASCEDALRETTDFVKRHDLLTLLHDPVEIIEMPEIDRGIAVAYCRGVGALETAPLHTQFAVSPTPSAWSAERVASFYREYNNHMLHNLTVHEAMPGHVEQLSHARRYHAESGDRTKVRSVYGNGTFIEGWAVYAESLMASHGYRSEVSDAAALAVRMQQLKMQLRMILNTILDISFHTADLDEPAAMRLMTVRGHQQDGEAAGKWRRVQLTSTQLSTYYVGYLEVRQLAEDLQAARPELGTRQRHDAILALGSPPVRYLRRLLGLSGAD